MISRSEAASSVPLLIRLLPGLDLLEVIGQAVEALRPEALERLDPVVDGLEPIGVELVQPPPARAAHADQPDLPQHPQVLGGLRLPEAECPGDVIDRPLAAGEQVEDLAAPGFGHRVEDVRSRRRACHAANIFRYGNISSTVAGRNRWRCGAMATGGQEAVHDSGW